MEEEHAEQDRKCHVAQRDGVIKERLGRRVGRLGSALELQFLVVPQLPRWLGGRGVDEGEEVGVEDEGEVGFADEGGWGLVSKG